MAAADHDDVVAMEIGVVHGVQAAAGSRRAHIVLESMAGRRPTAGATDWHASCFIPLAPTLASVCRGRGWRLEQGRPCTMRGSNGAGCRGTSGPIFFRHFPYRPAGLAWK